jgi:hypothetical protein
LKAVGAQIGQQLQHGLVDQLGVGAFEARMAGLRDPIARDLLELDAGHAGMGRHQQLHQAFEAGVAEGCHVVLERGLEGLLLLPFADAPAPVAFRRSSTKASWVYMGCSIHSVPSLSNTAMRSAGGT